MTLAVALAGCRQKGPDANYQKASQMFQRLYATELDDAYGDPKMDEVVVLLKQVDPHSIDAQPASQMLGSIERGRVALAKERAEREKLIAAAAAPTSPVGAIDPSMVIAASAPDAGAPQDPFGEGASVAEINRNTGGCLDPGEPFKEQNTNATGTIYRLARWSSACADKLPGFIGQAVLVVNGRIYRRIADPSPPSATRPAPDAGPPTPPPAPRAAAAPDAGPPAVQYYYPGQPVPGYVAPDSGAQ